MEGAKIDFYKVKSTLNTVKSILESVTASPPGPLDALRSAIKLERQLAEFHIDCLAFFEESSHREMFRAMMKADKGHVEFLEKTYQVLLEAGKEDRQFVAAP